MRAVPLGTRGSFTLTVGQDHLASRMKDSVLPPVLATPYLVLIVENAALDAIRPFLEPGESAVGTAVNIDHVAPTPVGHVVHGEAEVVKVDGRRIEFKVTVHDETEEIGKGSHERAVIKVDRFMQRLADKAKH